MLLELKQDGEPYQEENMCTEMSVSQETNNNEILNNFDESERCRTPIQEFYAGQKILITGGTGFLGKILIEKLLRSCPHVACLYLLVRPKKEKSAHVRIEELFQDRLFDRLKKEIPRYRDKIVAVHGDCSVERLGLSDIDRETLAKEVSIVFHVAATVRFNEKLKLAMAINVQSTNDIIEICKSMRKLKALVHVSTAYANCHEKRIEERFYTYSIHYEKLIRLMKESTEEEFEDKFQSIKGKWPNTYTFTKAMAEGLIREKSEDLPMGIFRPAVVISTAYEPVEGWVDNVYGATGMVAAVANGILRVVHCDPNIIANIVPVDITVNALIASAWDIYKHTRRKANDMLIYNFVASVEAPLTWQDYCRMNFPYNRQYPLSSTLWYPFFLIVKYRPLYMLLTFFLHIIPAILVDIAVMCAGQKPRLWKTYEKVHKFCDVITFFCIRDWTFDNNNVQAMWQRLNSKDKRLFRFTMANFDWQIYFKNYIRGIRLYIFKDELDNLESSKMRYRRLYWMHQILKTFVFVGGIWVMWNIFVNWHR
ncbi:hypothetical protein KPH14_011393 [Odynerus spinipes]|uniref:Fatty acyl-CoA reductase n=1 Tax=Odynerus spinipes TaxID=1348599 RepID=A0AAD9RVN7_9HYME|nr:hypothetical protein KPH14_011393 [Odynerus spinipes]